MSENTKLQYTGAYYKKFPVKDDTKELLVQDIKTKIGEKRPRPEELKNGNEDENKG